MNTDTYRTIQIEEDIPRMWCWYDRPYSPGKAKMITQEEWERLHKYDLLIAEQQEFLEEIRNRDEVK